MLTFILLFTEQSANICDINQKY